MPAPSLTERILQIARRFAAAAEAQQCGEVFLVMGVRRSSADEPLRIHWDIVSRGRLAEAARQHFERALFELKCCECGSEFDLTEGSPTCPACGGVLVEVVGARARCPDGAYE